MSVTLHLGHQFALLRYNGFPPQNVLLGQRQVTFDRIVVHVGLTGAGTAGSNQATTKFKSGHQGVETGQHQFSHISPLDK